MSRRPGAVRFRRLARATCQSSQWGPRRLVWRRLVSLAGAKFLSWPKGPKKSVKSQNHNARKDFAR